MNKNKRVQITHFHLSTAKLKRKVFHLNLNNVRTEEKRQKFPSNKKFIRNQFIKLLQNSCFNSNANFINHKKLKTS